ncbi:hypothetical protein QGM71_15735 [Virgibacillus sp. C22-A2]|uniref:Uncharacterized protein n=1 Tax=Virgibacillus tibetensis TaxID=3042313 RepID=A0ABU6KIK0_9BACI|nr:hypothetical protein [Virgibacillus sp. C22-A2]
MEKLEGQKLLKMGKKHQKWFESTSVYLDAYLINNHAYYLAIYKGRFSNSLKGHAILSPDSNDREEALQALFSLAHFYISYGNVEKSGKERAELDFSVLVEVRDYLKGIVDSGVLEHNKEIIYLRSLNIIQNMLTLQDEMVDLWREAQELYENVQKRGYIADEDIEKTICYPPVIQLIQYKQFKNRYDNRKDFDIIYENRNDPRIKPYVTSLEHRVLKAMTSNAAEQQIKETLDLLTKDFDFTNESESEMYEIWLEFFKESIEARVEDFKKTLRYP